MGIILNAIVVLHLTFFSWIALYIFVFTVSLAWHKGVQKISQEENDKLKKLAVEMHQKVEQITGKMEDFLAAARDQEKPPMVH